MDAKELQEAREHARVQYAENELKRYFNYRIREQAEIAVRSMERQGKDIRDYVLVEEYQFDEDSYSTSVKFIWRKKESG